MNAPLKTHQDHGFVTGLLTGAIAGAAVALWLTPRSAAELRQRMTESAKDLQQRASDGYRQASARVGGAVDEFARKGQAVRDDAADVVARGAREVERFAAVGAGDAKPRSL